MASVKGNIMLNGINTVTGILFPVITFPYAARVLMPEGIGAINFLNSIIGYIVLLTSLGIPMYAVKEVAKYRDDKAKRDQITVEIIALSFILCFLGYIAVWILAECVPQIHKQASLFYVLSLTIVFTTIGVNWFYQGIEDFKFITIRAIIIRTLSAAALFIFVKDSTDLLIYAIIIVGSTVGNNLINFIHLRKFIDVINVRITYLNIKRHIAPTLQVFALSVISGIYLQLNSIMLGFISGDKEVGYYTAGTKITHIGVILISSLGTVLLPRCSNLIQNKDTIGFKSIIHKSLNLTILLSLPLSCGIFVLAPAIVNLFCGPGYENAIAVIYWNAPVIVFISLSSVTGIQILYPLDKIKLIIVSIAGGAFINVIINIFAISKFGAAGASFASLMAEFVVLILQLYIGKSFFPFEIKDLIKPKYIVSCSVMVLVVYKITNIMTEAVFQLMGGCIVGCIVYMICLYAFKDDQLMDLIRIVKNKYKRAKDT